MGIYQVVEEGERWMENHVKKDNFMQFLKYALDNDNFKILYSCYLFLSQNTIYLYDKDIVGDICYDPISVTLYINGGKISLNIFSDCKKFSIDFERQFTKLCDKPMEDNIVPDTNLYQCSLIRDECIIYYFCR